MPRARVCCALAAVLLTVAACSRDAGARLLEVRAVTPCDVEPGDVLHVLGAGFPPGRDARVAWRGEARRPGELPVDVEVVSSGRAASAERVDVPVAGALARALAGATFRGDVQVVFQGRAGDVGGRLPHTMLVVAREPVHDARAEVARARRAAAFARVLGVTFDEESDVGGGARLAHVQRDGRAAGVGLLAGDVVTAVDGAVTASRDDVLPLPSAALAHFTVRREGAREAARVTVALDGATGEPPLAAVLLALALAVAGLFVLAWLSPLARVVDTLVARTERVLHRSPPWSSPAEVIGAALFTALATVLALRPAGVHVDLIVLGVAAAAGRVVAAIAAGGARTPRTLALAALRAVAGLAGLAGLLALLGTSALAGVVAAQSHSLLALGALRGPAQFACVVAVVEALVVTEAPSARSLSRLARGLDATSGALACTLVVLVALGAGAPTSAALRPFVAGGEAAALAVLAARWRDAHVTGPLAPAVLALGAALFATGVVLAGPHAADDPLLARATAITTGLAVLALGGLAVRARHARARWDLPRFL